MGINCSPPQLKYRRTNWQRRVELSWIRPGKYVSILCTAKVRRVQWIFKISKFVVSIKAKMVIVMAIQFWYTLAMPVAFRQSLNWKSAVGLSRHWSCILLTVHECPWLQLLSIPENKATVTGCFGRLIHICMFWLLIKRPTQPLYSCFCSEMWAACKADRRRRQESTGAYILPIWLPHQGGSIPCWFWFR